MSTCIDMKCFVEGYWLTDMKWTVDTQCHKVHCRSALDVRCRRALKVPCRRALKVDCIMALMCPVERFWPCVMFHFWATVLFPVMGLYLFHCMPKCNLHLFTNTIVITCTVFMRWYLRTSTVLPTSSGSLLIIIFLVMCLEWMDLHKHRLCIF